jgi:hypothetical protein
MHQSREAHHPARAAPLPLKHSAATPVTDNQPAATASQAIEQSTFQRWRPSRFDGSAHRKSLSLEQFPVCASPSKPALRTIFLKRPELVI